VSLRSLDVALVHVEGGLTGRRSMRLALHASCLLLDAGPRGSGSVSEPDRGIAAFALSEADCRALCAAAEEAGLEDRVPRVSEVADTSDRFARVTLVASHEKGSRTLQLDLMHSSYEGPDAAALGRFFGILLRAAGVRDEAVRADLIP
jgi:hypothetical protein